MGTQAAHKLMAKKFLITFQNDIFISRIYSFFLTFIILVKYFKNYQREIIIVTSFIFYSFWSPIFYFPTPIFMFE